MKTKKDELINILISKSVKIADTPEFKLASGKRSKIYIDCRKTTCNAQAMILIGNLIFDKIKNLNVNAIGGLTLGADPIANAVSYASEIEKKPINTFIVRKKLKKPGLEKMIEGNIKKSDKVVIVDDVITTGASTIEAIEKAREFGLCVVKAVVLVDRQEGGKENIEKTGISCEAIIKKADLFLEHLKRRK
jgi:orotate phosphoribosyltransferase